jgi:hypothetical protein
MKEMLLDRYGKLHKYTGKEAHPISVHSEIARILYPDLKHPEDYVMELGWIFIGSRFSSTYSSKKPNQAQINVLYDLKIQYVADFYSNDSWKIYE